MTVVLILNGREHRIASSMAGYQAILEAYRAAGYVIDARGSIKDATGKEAGRLEIR